MFGNSVMEMDDIDLLDSEFFVADEVDDDGESEFDDDF